MRPVVRLKGGRICFCTDAVRAGAARIAYCWHRSQWVFRDDRGSICHDNVSREEWFGVVAFLHQRALSRPLTGTAFVVPDAVCTGAALLFGASADDLGRPSPRAMSRIEKRIKARADVFWEQLGLPEPRRKQRRAAKGNAEVCDRQLRRRKSVVRHPLAILLRAGMSETAFFP